MRRMAVVVSLALMAGWPAASEAKEAPIEELPKDVWMIASLWTEPVKQAARETRRFDPISGAWFGLLEGTVKSFERAAGLFLPERSTDAPPPARDGGSGGPLLRYTF
jgi:hypothetical protein